MEINDMGLTLNAAHIKFNASGAERMGSSYLKCTLDLYRL